MCTGFMSDFHVYNLNINLGASGYDFWNQHKKKTTHLKIVLNQTTLRFWGHMTLMDNGTD